MSHVTFGIEHPHQDETWRVSEAGGDNPPIRPRLLVHEQAAQEEAAEIAALVSAVCHMLTRLLASPSVTIIVYYAVGIYAYGHLEGWGAVDTAYFLTVSVTTVGFGDITPQTQRGRLFTCAYALLGLTVVMAALVPLALQVLEKRMAFERFVVRQLRQAELSLELRSRRWRGMRGVSGGSADCDVSGDVSGEGSGDVSGEGGGDVSGRSRAGAGPSLRVRGAERVRGLIRLALFAVQHDMEQSAAERRRVAGAYYAARYAKTMLAPLTVALLGAALMMTISTDGAGFIDGFYWAVITMATIGFGDVVPTSAAGKLAVVCFLPPAVTAMADAVGQVARIAARRRIREAAYGEMGGELLLCEARRTGRLEQSLTETEFLISVLKSHDLIDDAVVAAIHQQFAHIVRHAPVEVQPDRAATATADNVNDNADQERPSGGVTAPDPSGARDPPRSRRRDGVLTCEGAFRELVRQRRIRQSSPDNTHALLRQLASGRAPEPVALVDLSAADGGFAEWRTSYFVPRLREALPPPKEQGEPGGAAVAHADAAREAHAREEAELVEASKPGSALANSFVRAAAPDGSNAQYQHLLVPSSTAMAGLRFQRTTLAATGRSASVGARIAELLAAALTRLVALIRLLNSSRLATLAVYYSFGIAAYRWLEGWGALEVVYFLTVMSTTVGYGDLVPKTPQGRLFTAFYALAGITTVISAINASVRSVLRQVGTLRAHAHRLGIWRGIWRGQATPRALRLETPIRQVNAEHANYPLDYLTKVALGPMVAILAGVVIGVHILGEGAVTSFYWSVATMTTIGYGDVAVRPGVPQAVAVVFLPLAVAALSHAISQLSHVATTKAIRETEYAWFVEELLVEAATVKRSPDPTLSEAEFLVSVLKSYDLVDDSTVSILRDAFEAMLEEEDGSSPARGGTSGGASGVEAGAHGSTRLRGERVFTPHVLFRSLVRKGHVKQRPSQESDAMNSATTPSSQSSHGAGHPAIALVDLLAPDGGYAEWKADHYDPQVLGRSSASLRPIPQLWPIGGAPEAVVGASSIDVHSSGAHVGMHGAPHANGSGTCQAAKVVRSFRRLGAQARAGFVSASNRARSPKQAPTLV